MRRWINNKYGTNFNEEDLQHVKDFSLIWNIFEAYSCENNFSIQKLQKKLLDRNLDANLFATHLKYFQNRYVENGTITDRFQFLHFRSNDGQQLVEDVLLGIETAPNNIILAITIIVYRFRNNLFHGLKDIQHIDQQNENFKFANKFLTLLIDNF